MKASAPIHKGTAVTSHREQSQEQCQSYSFIYMLSTHYKQNADPFKGEMSTPSSSTIMSPSFNNHQMPLTSIPR
ncbi:hypothetical protein HOLleu_05501 [Holothuria leucospilota]|uniref:Uncharacterized protein n=1 Tax=Holothuria leucospilota TaxID=206669 RepID=A0A9Q1CJP9_HOLLE|nr:hypothetical protein HOLleu_05501 [Holothuria leucospilota]